MYLLNWNEIKEQLLYLIENDADVQNSLLKIVKKKQNPLAEEIESSGRDVVIFKSAVKLKKLGFDLETFPYYDQKGDYRNDDFPHNWNQELSYYSCPSLYVAQKWLSYKKGATIAITKDENGWYCATLSLGREFTHIGKDARMYVNALSNAIDGCLDKLLS